MHIYLDTETIPCQDADLCALIAEGVKAPATMSVPATIAKWEVDKKPEAIEKAILQTSLDGTFGMICAIGLAVDDEPVRVVCLPEALAARNWTNAEALALGDLNIIMLDVQRQLKTQESLSIQFVGHNILGFDLRFLWQRYVINGIKPFSGFPIGVRYSGDKVYDTMTEWHPDRDKRISLDKLCKVLRVPTPKASMSGADVWPKMQAGQVQDVIDYCKADIEALRLCHRKMRFA